jgi:hypothetical protein
MMGRWSGGPTEVCREAMAMTRIKIGALLGVATLVGFAAGGLSLGAGGATPHYRVVEKTFSVPPNSTKIANVLCPKGMFPVGGGAHYGSNSMPGGNATYAYVAESDINLSHRGWSSTLVVTGTQSSSSFTADVTCASW